MGTTVAPADLTVITREIIELGGNQYNSQHTQIIGGIKEVTKRIITVPTSSAAAGGTVEGIELISFDDSLESGPYKKEDVRYLRITNLDNANFITLQFRSGDQGNISAFKLESGGTFSFTLDKVNGVAELTQASSHQIVNKDSTVGFTSGSTTVTCDPNPFLRIGTTLQFIEGSTTLYDSGSKITSILTTGSLTNNEHNQGKLGGVTSFTLSKPALLTASDQEVQFVYGFDSLRSIHAVAFRDFNSPSVDVEIFVASE